MKIEIWSDVMCPFCYIGKRHLEKAIEQLPFKNEITIQWKSYELNPGYKNTTGEDLHTYLSTHKGVAREQAIQMTSQVAQMASNAGLAIDLSKSIPANSFNAHRLVHFAATKDKQDLAEEALFNAHFGLGKNVDDIDDLLFIAEEIGLDKQETETVLKSNAFEDEVKCDVYESNQLGVRGVPFFLIDKRYSLSGAQPVEVFKQAITQGYMEFKQAEKEHDLKNLNLSNDNTCDEGGCEV